MTVALRTGATDLATTKGRLVEKLRALIALEFAVAVDMESG